MIPYGMAIGILVVPALQVALFRWAGHRALGHNVSVIGMHFSDVYWPLLLGLWMVLSYLLRQKTLTARFNPRTGLFNFICCLLTLFVLVNFDSLWTQTGSIALSVGLIVLGALTMGSSFFVFLNVGQVFNWLRLQAPRLWLLIAAAGMLFTFPYAMKLLWPVIIGPLGFCLKWTLFALGFSITRFEITHEILIHHPLLRVAVAMPCSGLHGVVFFLFAYFLYLFFSKYPSTLGRRIQFGLVGAGLMLVLNIFRIVLFFGVAIAIAKWHHTHTGNRFFVWAFHENIGWIIYLVGLFFIFRYLRAADQRFLARHQ